MKRPVSCTQCETLLEESSDLPPELRTPCPNCGSTARTFHVFASDTFTATDSAVATLTPGLLLQAVVTFAGKTDEGRLIESIAPAWLEIARLIKRDPSIIYQIDPIKWEEIIAGAYRQQGFDEVILTPRSGDFGRDIIAVKRGYFSVRVIDQVKAFNPDHRVSANDVRALLGVLLTDQNATKGIVTTTSDFAPGIYSDIHIVPHMPFRLELINGQELIKRLSALGSE